MATASKTEPPGELTRRRIGLLDVYGATAGILHVATPGATASPRKAVAGAPLAEQVKWIAGACKQRFLRLAERQIPKLAA